MKIANPILLLLVILVTLDGCKKEEAKPDCEVNKYGTITVFNNSTNPYDIYIDGVFNVRLSGGAISSGIKINEGNSRTLYAVQVSGYLIYPTEKTTDFNVLSCSDYTWQIP